MPIRPNCSGNKSRARTIPHNNAYDKLHKARTEGVNCTPEGTPDAF